ncbi:MAG: pilus (MSHA type) biogenesis protein MshL [Rhodocyclaceae bacterium]
MTLTRIQLALLCAGLAACSSNPKVHDKPREAIRAEIDNAARLPEPSNRTPGTVREEIYPSLRMNMPPALDKLVEPRFDLVVSNAPVREVFLGMVSDTRYSMLLPNDLTGRITVNLKDVTVPEALSALQQLYGYEYKIDGSRIMVQPQTLQTRIMKVNYLNGVRRGSSDIRVISGSVGDAGSSGSGSGGSGGAQSNAVVTSKISTTGQSDFWGDLTTSVNTIVGKDEGRRVVISPQSGVIVVRAMPGELSQVEAFLRASQVALERQVVIEAKIIEVSLNDNFQSGINWALFGGNRVTAGQLTPGSSMSQGGAITTSPITSTAARAIGNVSNAAGAMFGMVLRTSNFSAVLNLLEEQGRVHVLSSPRVATLNNQKALLKVGNDDFFVTEVSTNTSTSASGASTVSPKLTLQPFFSGISLDVTPQIDEENQITLHVHPMISKVTSVTQEIDLGALGNFRLPLASSQISEMDSVVKALDGQMIALGGLIRQASNNNDSQVPVLGEIPLLGSLFKQKGRETERRELVILLKPTVIMAPSDWANDISRSQVQIRRLTGESGTDRSNLLGDRP